jgi:CxxC motif-containing protein (DUF1111 family)
MADTQIMDPAPDPEVNTAELDDLMTFLRLLAPPERGEITPSVMSGEAHFQNIGCAECHVPTLRTGNHSIPSFSNIDAPLYSDLLIHDMGQVPLADNRVDGSASGREWRTAPLWGIGAAVDRPGITFLHNGIAPDLPSAIRAHGGEALQSRIRFESLSSDEQDQLIAFLASL